MININNLVNKVNIWINRGNFWVFVIYFDVYVYIECCNLVKMIYFDKVMCSILLLYLLC